MSITPEFMAGALFGFLLVLLIGYVTWALL